MIKIHINICSAKITNSRNILNPDLLLDEKGSGPPKGQGSRNLRETERPGYMIYIENGAFSIYAKCHA